MRDLWGDIIIEGSFIKNAPYILMLQEATGRSVLFSAGSETGTSIGAALLLEVGASLESRGDFYKLNVSPLSQNYDMCVSYARKWQTHVMAVRAWGGYGGGMTNLT